MGVGWAKEIVMLAEKNEDSIAVKTLQRLTYFYGRGLSVIINIVDPDVIVIGGGVGNIDLIYTTGREEVVKNVFNNRLETPLVRPMHGDSAGVFGAAFLMDKKVDVVHTKE